MVNITPRTLKRRPVVAVCALLLFLTACSELGEGADWQIDKAELTFLATTGLSAPPPKALVLRNNGQVRSDYTVTVSESWLSVSEPEGSLSPGGSITLNVLVTACQAPDRDTASLTISGGSDQAHITVTRDCEVEPEPQPAPQPETQPDIGQPAPNPVLISTQVGQTRSASLSFGNEGEAELAYSVNASAGWLELASDASGTLEPGTSASIDLRATCPATAGDLETTLTVESNDPDEPRKPVQVRLTCAAPTEPPPEPEIPAMSEPEPNPLELEAEVGRTASGAISFQNLGDAELTFEVADDQSWLSLTPGSGSLSPGEVQNLAVEAHCPDTAGDLSATVTINANDPDTPRRRVTVTLHCSQPRSAGGAFDIQLRFVDSGLSESQKAIFQEAVNRWAEVITSELADTALQLPAYCAQDYPSYSGTVDDLMIDVAAPYMDGQYGVLGRAGPCFTRSSSGLPIYGVMEFDQADIDWLEQQGRLQDTILHEMGHVLGIGTMWESLGFLAHNGSSCQNASQVGYTGPQAKAEYAEMGGSGNVPVENNGDSGTKCGHWDEATFGQELMTGTLNSSTANPLSRLTVGSLDDMGYQVDYAAADSYTFSTLAPLAVDERHRLEEILITPRFELEPPSGL